MVQIISPEEMEEKLACQRLQASVEKADAERKEAEAKEKSKKEYEMYLKTVASSEKSKALYKLHAAKIELLDAFASCKESLSEAFQAANKALKEKTRR